MRRAGRESGQAAVEAAIVLPLFVFLLLGILQLGLMHQARLLTKYAAYKAVRAGALHHAKVETMESAALAVLLPLISQKSGGSEYIKSITGAPDFQSKWQLFHDRYRNEMPEVPLKYAQVTICGPLKKAFPGGRREVDFDDPAWSTGEDWEKSERTKLRIQVTFNYRMPIPFANWVIHATALNKEIPWFLRMGKTPGPERSRGDAYSEAARQDLYILPIRTTYTMRMQSNLYLGDDGLPEINQCVFRF